LSGLSVAASPFLFEFCGSKVDNVISQVCYTNATEVIFAALTVYQLRLIERLWGSRKFAVRQLHSSFQVVPHFAWPYL